MSAIGHDTNASDEARLEQFPSFGLEYLFDDDERPSEVTVFVDNAADLSTNWITMDAAHAVPLEDVR